MNSHVELFLLSMIGIIGLWVLLFGFWRNYCLDRYRDDVFAVRDELFLYAATGHIEFSNPAYRMLRERMNSAIRFGHEFTLFRLTWFAVNPGAGTNRQVLAWEQAIKTVGTQLVVEELEAFRNRYVVATIKYIVRRSVLLSFTLVPLKKLNQLRDWTKRKLLPKLTVGIVRIETNAMDQEPHSKAIPA